MREYSSLEFDALSSTFSLRESRIEAATNIHIFKYKDIKI